MMFSGLFALLVFLINVQEANSPSETDCDWVCKIDDILAENVSAVLSKMGQMKAIFLLHKRVAQIYENFTSIENSSSFIEVWISTPASDESFQPREFSFMSFVVFNFLENVLPFRYLFDGKYTEHEVNLKISPAISCVLQPTSTKSKRLSRTNGLDALISPYFYIGKLANVSQIRPFISHIWTENVYTFSAGFTNLDKKSETSTQDSKNSLRFERWQKIVSHAFWIIFTFYSASFLILFRTNTSTVEIPGTSINSPSTHDTKPGVVKVEPARLQTLNAAQKQQDNHNNSSSRPIEWHNEDERYAASGVSPSLKGCHTVSYSEQSVFVNIPSPSAVTEVADSSMGKRKRPARTVDTIEQEAEQSGAHNRDKKNFKSVRVIRVWKAPSSVGLRSLIANYLLRYGLVKLFFLFFTPVFPIILLDLFLLPPRLFSRIAPSLPSTSLTIAVFCFIYEKSPGLLVFLFFYSIRCFCLCFAQSAANRVPSFLLRKHLWCFILNLFNSDSFRCDDECKETLLGCPNECEIPLNIKRNIETQLDIPMKDWKDINHFFQKYSQRFSGSRDRNTSSCSVYCSGFFKNLCRLVLYIIVCTLDFFLSSPLICACYGRVWVTRNWYQGEKKKQFACLFVEFVFICFSILWAVYLSICCSVALQIAFLSLLSVFFKYPEETPLQWSIYIIVYHILWSRYRSFTNKYDDLELMVFNMCIENHAEEVEQYRKKDVINIPEDLLVSVRNKCKPLRKSVRKLIKALLVWASILLFILLVVSCNTEPNSKVLSAIVTLLIVLRAWLSNFIFSRGKQKELKDAELKESVKHHVATYFKKKLD